MSYARDYSINDEIKVDIVETHLVKDETQFYIDENSMLCAKL